MIANPPLRRPSVPLALRTLWRMDFTRDPRLRKVAHPTLVIWGADDKVNRPDGGRMLAEAMPNCDLYLAANTGHWVQWERAGLADMHTAAQHPDRAAILAVVTPAARTMRTVVNRGRPPRHGSWAHDMIVHIALDRGAN